MPCLTWIEYELSCAVRNVAVTLKQVRLGDVVICRGCKASISLIDHMHEIANARQRLQAALRSFRELAGNPLKITLRL